MNFLQTGKKRYYSVFLIREQNTYNVIKKRRFNPENTTIRYKKGNSHHIDVSIPTYSKGLNLYFLIDIKEGQLEFGETKGKKLNPELLDMIVHQNIIKQLTANLNEKMFGGGLLNMIMAFLMGGLLGFIIASFL